MVVVIHRRERSFNSPVSANGDRVPYEQPVEREFAWASVHMREETITHQQRANNHKTDKMLVTTAFNKDFRPKMFSVGGA